MGKFFLARKRFSPAIDKFFSNQAEQIVMTPKCKTADSTTLIIERQKQITNHIVNGDHQDVHVAGGDHKGIVINKQMAGMGILKNVCFNNFALF